MVRFQGAELTLSAPDEQVGGYSKRASRSEQPSLSPYRSGTLRSPSGALLPTLGEQSSPSGAIRSPTGLQRSPRSSARLSQAEIADGSKHAFLRKKRVYDPRGAESQTSEAMMKERLKSYGQVAVASHKLGQFASAHPSTGLPERAKALKHLSPLAMAGQETMSPRPIQPRVTSSMSMMSRQISGSTEHTEETLSPKSPRMKANYDHRATRVEAPTPKPAPKLADQRLSEDRKADAATEPTELLLEIARKLGMNFSEVKAKYKEFDRLDIDRNGWLTRDEFEDAVRVQCCLDQGQPLPEQLSKHCFTAADKNRNGRVDFEEFLQWTCRHEFTEEWLVADENERRVRKFVRQHGLCIADVDAVRTVFRKLDIDDSGTLDADEFRTALCTLLQARRREDVPESTLRRYWKDVDLNGDGHITFEEFALWYFDLRERH